ncbi:MAG: DUF4160 domain-containing protein [Bacteroidia bacterium]
MPVVLEINGFKFKFYSNENNEPVHIHITKGGGSSKYWLEPVIDEAYSYGFTVRERRIINQLINENVDFLKNKWNEYFAKK